MPEIKKTLIKKQFNFSEEELKNIKEIIGENIPFESIIEAKNIPSNKISKTENISFNINEIAQPEDLSEVVYKLIENKNVVSKNKTFEAKTFDLKIGDKAIAVSSAFNLAFLNSDIEKASIIAVAEAYKKVICTGAEPLALACNIDFENKDEKTLKSLAGIKTICTKLNLAITEDKSKLDKDLPYSTISVIGIIKDKSKKVTSDFKEKGNMIFLIGESKEDISSSEYLSDFHEVKKSPTPIFNLEEESKINEVIKQVIADGLVQSASVISKGGLFFSLLESAIPNNLGFDVTTDAEVREDSYLFSEAQGRAVVTVADAFEEDFIDFMIANNYTFSTIGHITKGDIRIDDESYGNIKDIKEIYEYILTK